MTEYYRLAWDELMKLTGLSPSQLYEVIIQLGIKVTNNTFIIWRTNGGIPPQHLVTICNHFRFPISYFSRVISRELEPREFRLFSEEEWTDIEFVPSNIPDRLANVEHRSRKEAMRILGCSAGYYDAFRRYPTVELPTRLTFTDMLEYINNARMYPGDVFIDHNVLFLLEYDIHPFYDSMAMSAYQSKYPDPKTTLVAEKVIDVKEFMFQYFTKGHLEGDDTIIGMSLHDLNEMGGIIATLRRENDDLRQYIKELQSEISELKESLKLLNP